MSKNTVKKWIVGHIQELSLTHTTIFKEVIGNWLLRYRVKIEGTIWQTDGGGKGYRELECKE